MTSFTYLLLEGQKISIDVHPDEINTVPVTLTDGSTVYAVAGEEEEKKLLALQEMINEENQIIELMQCRDQSSAA